MKLRLVIAVLFLAIAAGILYWSEHRKPGAENTTSSPAAPPILKLDPADIVHFTIQPRDREPVTLAKTATGKWEITQPKSLHADQDAVSSLLSTLSPLNSDRVVEDQAANLEQYGLARPAVEVDITSGKKTQSLLIGDDTPTGGTVYAMVEGDPRVFTTSSTNKTALDKGLNDLRDKRLLTVNFDSLRDIELLRNSQAIEFDRSGDSWKIAKPRPLRTDQLPINEIVDQLRNAKMDISGPQNNDQAAAFAHATPFATVKVTDNGATQTLQVRKSKDEYYATSSAVEGTYKVDPALGQALDKNLDDFRNKKLFDFSYNDPNKLELHSGNADYVFTRNGQDWWSSGKKMDADAVESLVSSLRDLTASKFAGSGFTAPEITATVTSEDGKNVEQVLIAKSGKSYIAKREDGPDLYQLEPGVVEGVETAASAIKPVAGTAKSKSNAGNPGK